MNNLKFLRVASDLHIEGNRGQKMDSIANTFLPAHEDDKSSILVLAGDISSYPAQLVEFLSAVESRFLAVVFVPGNHEFYNHDINEWKQSTQKLFDLTLKNTYAALDNVRNEAILGINFVFGTLWGDGGKTKQEQHSVDNGLNDFHLIRNGQERYKVLDMIELNNRDRKSLDQFLVDADTTMPVVVVTHHIPSYALCHPRFGNSITGGFASSCDDLMVDGSPNLWIHGHTHDTMDKMFYGTRIVCNPYGYRYENNKSSFNSYSAKFIDVTTL